MVSQPFEIFYVIIIRVTLTIFICIAACLQVIQTSHVRLIQPQLWIIRFVWHVTITVVSCVCSICILASWLVWLFVWLKVRRSIILRVSGFVAAPAGVEYRLMCMDMADP